MSKQSNEFSIGTVARLVGVSTHTLRAWEKRYGLDIAHRTESGHRIYNGSAIERLKLIKQAVDANYKISDIAALSVYELANLEKVNQSSAQSFSELPSQVLIYGERLSARLFRTKPEFGYRVVSQMSDLVTLLNKYPTLIQAVIFECNDIDDNVERLLYEIRLSLGSKPMSVFCQQVESEVQVRLEQAQVTVLPLDQFESLVAELNQAIQSSLSVTHSDEEWLGFDIAAMSEKDSELSCICPSHLTVLLERVDEFIQYSDSCEKQSPKDYVMHEHLSEKMQDIRKQMTKLCQQVALIDGLETFNSKVLQ